MTVSDSTSPSSVRPFCIYCTSSVERVTKDHVPPKCLFPPNTQNLITVPACEPCNKSFNLDDEYFRLMMTAEAAYWDPRATQIWKERVIPNMGPGLRMSVLRGMRLCDIRTEGGLYVGRATRLHFDPRRIRRIVERIAIGLLWHHYMDALLPGSVIETHYKPDLALLNELLLASALSEVGDTVFRYRHGRAWDAPDSSFWGFQFYGQAHFVVVIIGPSRATAERLGEF